MKITSGYTGYKKAASCAFSDSGCMNPAIKYGPEDGFYVESDLIPTSRGHVNLGQVYYNLNQVGTRSAGTMGQYMQAKADIIEALEGSSESFHFMREHAEWFFPD